MRTNIVSLVAGTRGTGKTDWVKDLLYAQSAAFRKRLILDLIDSEPWHSLATFKNPHQVNVKVPILPIEMFERWQTGIYRMFGSNVKEMMHLIQTHARDCMIVFEDATKYVGSKLTDDMLKFVIDSKQKNLDLIFIFHSLVSIPPGLVRVADTLTMFKTNEGKPSNSKYPFPEIPKLMDNLKKSSNRYENITIRLN